jgi:hypothetical protein
VDTKTLAKQFDSDPGLAFIETIRCSSAGVRAIEIKREIITAGARPADVDRQWKRLQPMLKLHPRISLRSNRYAWTDDPRPARGSLEVLAGLLPARLPSWLGQALVQNVTDHLPAGQEAAEDAGGTWSGKEFEKARLVADLAVAVDVLRSRGAGLAEVADLFTEEARRKRLWPIGRPGETVPFDPAAHEPESGRPGAGTTVEVVRSGYVWQGGDEPIVAAKAVVTT